MFLSQQAAGLKILLPERRTGRMDGAGGRFDFHFAPTGFCSQIFALTLQKFCSRPLFAPKILLSPIKMFAPTHFLLPRFCSQPSNCLLSPTFCSQNVCSRNIALENRQVQPQENKLREDNWYKVVSKNVSGKQSELLVFCSRIFCSTGKYSTGQNWVT